MPNLLIENYQDLKNITSTILNEGSKSGEEYEDNYKKTGKKSKDYDKDGEVEDEADEYAGVKDKAIKKAMAKEDEDVDTEDDDEDESETEDDNESNSKKNKKKSKKEVEESYSNWRNDLFEKIENAEEIINNSSKPKEVKERPNIKNTIEINPKISENFSTSQLRVLETYELGESYLNNLVENAAEYFYNEGLNEDGIEILFGNLGEDKFIDFIYDISENYVLTEAKLKSSQAGLPARTREKITGKTVTRKKPEDLTGAARSAKQRGIDKQRELRAAAKAPAPLTARQERIAALTKASREKAMSKATSQQSNKKPTRKGIAHGILNILDRTADAFAAGVERHNKAMKNAGEMANQTKKTAEKAKPVIGHFMKSAGKGFTGTAKVARKLINAETDLLEFAPPSPKFERMVKHIKKKYSEGGLTKKEMEIAYATAWKAYNKSKKK